MEMDTIFISSYYSDVDYRDNADARIDGLYKIKYPAGWAIDFLKTKIKDAYNKLGMEGEPTNELGLILDRMIKDGDSIKWCVEFPLNFDCDYGLFDSDLED